MFPLALAAEPASGPLPPAKLPACDALRAPLDLSTSEGVSVAMRALPDIIETFVRSMSASVGTQRSNCPREPVEGRLEGPCQGRRPGEFAKGTLVHREESGVQTWTLTDFYADDGKWQGFGGNGTAELIRHDSRRKTARFDIVVRVSERMGDPRDSGTFEWRGTEKEIGDHTTGHHVVYARPATSKLHGDFCVDEDFVRVQDCELRGDFTLRGKQEVVVRFDGVVCDRCGTVIRNGKPAERWCW